MKIIKVSKLFMALALFLACQQNASAYVSPPSGEYYNKNISAPLPSQQYYDRNLRTTGDEWGEGGDPDGSGEGGNTPVVVSLADDSSIVLWGGLLYASILLLKKGIRKRGKKAIFNKK